MSSNLAAIESLECYMEDLVECFEQFVKKTLLVVTLAAGALVAVLMYFVKYIQSRTPQVMATQNRLGHCRRPLFGERNFSRGNCSSQVLVSSPSFARRCRDKHSPSCTKLVNCPSSCSTKSSVKKLLYSPLPCAPATCSREASCESLLSRSTCRSSETSICPKELLPSKSSCSNRVTCVPAPTFSPASVRRNCPRQSLLPPPTCRTPYLSSPCKQSCIPSPCKQSCMPSPCKQSCIPPPCKRSCSPSRCSKLGRITLPSLTVCNPPTYKPESLLCESMNICKNPERCPSQTCLKLKPKSSCCSICCDEE